MTTERVALYTGDWESPQQGTENTASLLVEQGERQPLHERINYVEIYLDDERDLWHPAFGKLKDCVSVESKIDELEKQAIEKLTKWACGKTPSQAIWISPPYPGQEESRIIVYEKLDERTIALHAICGNQSAEGCLFIAQQISAFSGLEFSIENEADLRETPIPFEPRPFYPSWVDFLEELIQPPEVWQAIREGKHIERKQELLTIAEIEIQRFYPEVASAETHYQHLVVGAKIEEAVAKYGHKIRPISPCGISNSLALQQLYFPYHSRLSSPFNLMFGQVALAEASFPCPRCQKPIPSGRGITKCPYCGVTKEEVGSVCD
jgi:hypothetical protein